jgi:hypothetical protein
MLLLLGLVFRFQNVRDFELLYTTALWWCLIKLGQVRPGGGGLNMQLEEFHLNLIYELSTDFNISIFWGSLRPGDLRTEICCLTCNKFSYWFHTKNKA